MAKYFKNLWPVLLIIAVALYSVWPFVVNIGGVAVDDYDGLLLVWVYNQNIQKIPWNLVQIFQGNIFYPFKNTMAFADLNMISSVLSYVPVKILKEPTVILSTSTILGQILTMLVVYFWFFDVTKNRWSSTLGAILLGLSQIRFHYIGHLQMWNMQYWLISAWIMWRFVKNEKAWQLYVSLIFLALQFWESVLPVYFALFSFVFILFKRKELLRRKWKHFAASISLFLIMIYPLIKAYLSVSNEFDYERSIRDAANFSMSVNDTWGVFFSPALFIVFGAVILTNFKRIIKGKEIKVFLYLACFSFMMALGPVLKWSGATFKFFEKYFVPLPYGIFYYVIPGFGALRTPSRWIWVFALSLTFIIVWGLRNFKERNEKLFILIFVVVTVITASRLKGVIRIPTVNEYPKVYTWLEEQPGEVILELPAYRWGSGVERIETYRMLYSLKHGKKLVNGYSGFTPPQYEKLVEELRDAFPSEHTFSSIELTGADYIVVNKDMYATDRLDNIKVNKPGKKMYEDDSYIVYEI